MKFNIIFNNENFIAVDKPGGLLSVPGRFSDSRDQSVGQLLQDEIRGQLYPVHRLDQPVSGLLLFAKNVHAQRRASTWFERRVVKKSYEAISGSSALGLLKVGDSFNWKSKLVRGKKRSFEADYGKTAITEAKVVAIDSDRIRLIWEIHPITGRSHQIRVHMSKNGFPILGDDLYGSTVEFTSGQIALRSYELSFDAIPVGDRLGLPSTIYLEKKYL